MNNPRDPHCSHRKQIACPVQKPWHRRIRPLYKHPTALQASDRYTGIPPLYRHPTTIQASDHYTGIRPLYMHPTTTQASKNSTETQPLSRNPATIQKSSQYTEIQCFPHSPLRGYMRGSEPKCVFHAVGALVLAGMDLLIVYRLQYHSATVDLSSI